MWSRQTDIHPRFRGTWPPLTGPGVLLPAVPLLLDQRKAPPPPEAGRGDGEARLGEARLLPLRTLFLLVVLGIAARDFIEKYLALPKIIGRPPELAGSLRAAQPRSW